MLPISVAYLYTERSEVERRNEEQLDERNVAIKCMRDEHTRTRQRYQG